MAILKKDKKVDILFWANLNPNKRGSFEDYICHLASACQANGLKIIFLLGNEINNSLRMLFDEFSVSLIPLSSKELNSIGSVIKILKNSKPKIVHFNFLGFGSPLILVCKLMGVDKVVLTDHKSTSLSMNSSQDGGVFDILKQVRRRFYIGRIDHFVGVSNFVGDRLKKRSAISSEKVKIIYNGVDLERFRPPSDEVEKGRLKREFFNVDETIPVVTYIGQLTEEKGLIVYLESIQKLLRNHDDILFNFVGAGPLESRLIHFIEQAKNKMIRFLGFRDDAEIILKASDIVIVPSIWEEAFGLVIAEALACGVPVIGSRIGGIPEVLLDQKTGILTTPGDSEELARAIERLVYDKNLREYFSTQGRKQVENNFGLQRQVFETLNLYQSYLH
jgi:glycosyltransferase involved in cell wall biosynthesis